ncbi:cysteine synthase A [Lachnospiraceae bacterium KGMB03038]|nr:cysteine synthase A [Lachnospiraceae bacterium KGMB03038]
MGNIAQKIEELVGRTPLLEVCGIEKEKDLKAKLLVKLELFNPAGSVKDRTALSMIQDGEENGLLGPGSVIIEPTSGNTGIGLASIGASRGYRVIFTMPETMSIERRKLLKGYGAEIILTPGAKGMSGAIEEAERLAETIEGGVVLGQFTNPANPAVHYRTTGPEIWEDTDGRIDIFVAGAGTGGTITGAGKYLKEQNPDLQVVAVEPAKSPVLSGGQPGPHGLQGIGAGFVPEILDTGIYDQIALVKEEEAYEAARLLARKEGVLVGISSGAALSAGIRLAKEEANVGKTIVVLLPDTGERYLSTPLFKEG